MTEVEFNLNSSVHVHSNQVISPGQRLLRFERF